MDCSFKNLQMNYYKRKHIYLNVIWVFFCREWLLGGIHKYLISL